MEFTNESIERIVNAALDLMLRELLSIPVKLFYVILVTRRSDNSSWLLLSSRSSYLPCPFVCFSFETIIYITAIRSIFAKAITVIEVSYYITFRYISISNLIIHSASMEGTLRLCSWLCKQYTNNDRYLWFLVFSRRYLLNAMLMIVNVCSVYLLLYEFFSHSAELILPTLLQLHVCSTWVFSSLTESRTNVDGFRFFL